MNPNKTLWEQGDFTRIAETMRESGEDVVRQAGITRGMQVLDLGCGGPEPYTGRDLVLTHKGMNISEQEYMAAMDDILAALEKNDIDPATRGEVTAVLYSLKGQVIRV